MFFFWFVSVIGLLKLEWYWGDFWMCVLVVEEDKYLFKSRRWFIC